MSPRLAAAFYLPSEDRRTLDQLAKDIGAPIAWRHDGAEPSCKWSGLQARPFVANGKTYRIFYLSFSQSAFFEIDGTDQLPNAFRDACQALEPFAAVIAVYPDQAQWESILGFEKLVADREANRLAGQGLGMLYFSPELDDYWVPSPEQEDRDVHPIRLGRLLFAGRGDHRWFG